MHDSHASVWICNFVNPNLILFAHDASYRIGRRNRAAKAGMDDYCNPKCFARMSVSSITFTVHCCLLVWCSRKKHEVQKSCPLPLPYVVKCCCTKQLKYPALFAVMHTKAETTWVSYGPHYRTNQHLMRIIDSEAAARTLMRT
jgi:hypothetical protein